MCTGSACCWQTPAPLGNLPASSIPSLLSSSFPPPPFLLLPQWKLTDTSLSEADQPPLMWLFGFPSGTGGPLVQISHFTMKIKVISCLNKRRVFPSSLSDGSRSAETLRLLSCSVSLSAFRSKIIRSSWRSVSNDGCEEHESGWICRPGQRLTRCCRQEDQVRRV